MHETLLLLKNTRTSHKKLQTTNIDTDYSIIKRFCLNIHRSIFFSYPRICKIHREKGRMIDWKNQSLKEKKEKGKIDLRESMLLHETRMDSFLDSRFFLIKGEVRNGIGDRRGNCDSIEQRP